MELKNNTPYSNEFDDIYFSPEDGVAETKHVFLNGNNITEKFTNLNPYNYFKIAETGFGTGLNFLVTATEFLNHAPDTAQLFYYSFEKFPLAASEIKTALNRWNFIFGNLLDQLCNNYPVRVNGWHKISIHPRITLILVFDDATNGIKDLPTHIHAWYLDGFAPSKNPDLWSDDLFTAIKNHSYSGSSLATFTAAGHVRRGLESAGFKIEKTKGFGRKRDMVIGTYTANDAPTYQIDHLSQPQKIAIIGGGIAGLSTARTLQNYGHDVTLFEQTHIASGGSGNPIGLYNPRLTAQQSHDGIFYTGAFAHAHHLFQSITKNETQDIQFNPIGAFHFITDVTKEKRFSKLLESNQWHKSEIDLFSATETSELVGLKTDYPSLCIKHAGYISPHKLCTHLAQTINIQINAIEHISQTPNGQWLVHDTPFDHVIITNGTGYNKIHHVNLPTLPIQIVRGQITTARLNPNHTQPTHALCYGGYIAPIQDNEYVIGSTFQPWLDTPHSRDEDNEDNLSKICKIFPSLNGQFSITGDRTNFRATAKDRLPAIGEAAPRSSLWLNTAHGSHGLVSAPMGATLIAHAINNAPAPLAQSCLNALNPKRFEINAKNAKD